MSCQKRLSTFSDGPKQRSVNMCMDTVGYMVSMRNREIESTLFEPRIRNRYEKVYFFSSTPKLAKLGQSNFFSRWFHFTKLGIVVTYQILCVENLHETQTPFVPPLKCFPMQIRSNNRSDRTRDCILHQRQLDDPY